MSRMLFIQFLGLDGKPEAAASVYHEKKELPPGLWSVSHSITDQREVMSQFEMPEHWREQLRRWGQWFEKYAADG